MALEDCFTLNQNKLAANCASIIYHAYVSDRIQMLWKLGQTERTKLFSYKLALIVSFI